jgi:PAS domain S-box-containing protein
MLACGFAIGAMLLAAILLHRQVQLHRLLEITQRANDTAGVSVWEWDLAAKTVRIHSGDDFLSRSGNRTVFPADDYVQVVHPEERDDWIRYFTTQLNDRSVTQLSRRYRILCNGMVRYIQFCGRVQRNARGRALRVIGVDWDVTAEATALAELQEQAKQLRDAELRLERASLSSAECHWDVDFRTGQRWYSSSCTALLGYSPAELLKMSEGLCSLMTPASRAEHDEVLNAHLQTGGDYEVVIAMRTAGGDVRWFHLKGKVEVLEDGSVRASGSIRDVHEQKLAEDALREARAHLERAILGTQDALFESDFARDSLWLSPRVYEVLGYSEGEIPLYARGFGKLMHPDDLPDVRRTLESLTDGTSLDLEQRMRKKDGTWIWVRTRARVERGPQGNLVRVSGSFHDITEARAAREELVRATARAEDANRAKSAFLATMSHEIRTPMNGILGMTGMLLDTPLDRVQRDYAETIRSSAESLLRILNDVLDFSKIEAGKLDIEYIELDLHNTVEGVGALLALEAAAKNLELIVDVAPDVPRYVRGDPQRIRQCLLNLVSNAIKFTAAGEVKVTVSRTPAAAGGDRVRFEVRDTGIGIAPEVLRTLFQPFTQADSSTTRKFGGTGLGLSIVHRLVGLMHGECGANSVIGQGSTFWFELPLTAVQKTVALSALPGLACSILLVEENATARSVLARQLSRHGYQVIAVANSDEACQVLAREETPPIYVVLIDAQLHDESGIQLGRRIVEACQLGLNGGHVPRLVLLTALDRSAELQRLADLGFSAYLGKPVSERELLACLETVLSHDTQEWQIRTQPIAIGGVARAHALPPQDRAVLVVEDNTINQRVAQSFLQRLGCEVHIAENGLEAVELIAKGEMNFGLILMDMQMPVMDGVEATRRIRELERYGRRTPIVALTANAMADQLQHCLEAGMDDYLTKPLEMARLRDVVERFMPSERPAARASTNN